MSDWGRVRLGPVEASGRSLVFILGVGWWIAGMLLRFGRHGWEALAAAVWFVAGLALLTAATRTVATRRLVFCFLIGGLTMTLSWALIRSLNATLPAGPEFIGIYLAPAIEETLKLGPVVLLVWLRRRTEAFTLGALDLMLMAAACGAGFGMVEEAHIRASFSWPDVRFLPAVATTSVGRLIAGHAFWSALAGLTLGTGMLLRTRLRWAPALGAFGFAWAVLDHMLTNYYSGHSGDPFLLWRIPNAVGFAGYLTPYLLGAGLLAATALEAWILYVRAPRHPELRLPWASLRAAERRPVARIGAAWNFLRERRRLAFADFYCRTRHGNQRRRAAGAAAASADRLLAQTRPG